MVSEVCSMPYPKFWKELFCEERRSNPKGAALRHVSRGVAKRTSNSDPTEHLFPSSQLKGLCYGKAQFMGQ